MAFAWNHEGLGHVNRLAAVATEICRRLPDTSSLFFVEQPYDLLSDAGILQVPVVVPDGSFTGNIPRAVAGDDEPPLFCGTLRAFLGDILRGGEAIVALHDSVVWEPLREACMDAGVPQVLVLRDRVDLASYVASLAGVLPQVGAIVVPHLPTDRLRRALHPYRHKVAFVGPVVRARPEPLFPWWRNRPGEDRLVLVSAGGGGYPDVGPFLSTVLEASARLPGPIHVVVVTGPLFRGRVETRPRFPHRLTVLPYEPDLPTLLHDVDAAVTQAGYNTINELRTEGVPAVIVPSPRSYDDQFLRAQVASRSSGCPILIGEPTVDGICQALGRALASPRGTPAARGDGAEAAAVAVIDRCGLRTTSSPQPPLALER
jgi:hypothetical protein